jgi:tetratricopeptide (TPR) repeat protein
MWMQLRHLYVLLPILVILGSAPVIAAQDDSRLPGLFNELKRARNISAAKVVESQIWDIWFFNGNARVDSRMRDGIVAMGARNYPEALRAFNLVIEEAPQFAEGWNKRATVYYLMNNYEQSIRDIRQTLALEPRHFGAVSGLGLIYLELGDGASALEAFQRVLKINPHNAGTRIQVEILRRQFGGKAI